MLVKPFGIALMTKLSPSFWDILSRTPSCQPHKPPFQARVNLHKISVYDFLIANMHDVASTDDDHVPDDSPQEPDTSLVDSDASNDVRPINAAKSNGGSIPPGDIHRAMSKASTRHPPHQ